MCSREVGETPFILVVEDHLGLRELIESVLMDAGYDVVTAATADEALRIGDQKPVDVLLTDLGLPGTNGYDLVERFQARAHHSRIVLMSGAEPQVLRTRALGAEFLPKPFTAKSLLAVVSKSLGIVAGDSTPNPSV